MPERKKASANGAVDIMRFPAPDFDVRDYARDAAASHRDELGLDGYKSHPLSTESLRLIRYLQIIERATMTHLRGVLVTATHKDARITAFLTTWAFEKYWIADAFEQTDFLLGVRNAIHPVREHADAEPAIAGEERNAQAIAAGAKLR